MRNHVAHISVQVTTSKYYICILLQPRLNKGEALLGVVEICAGVISKIDSSLDSRVGSAEAK
jgi:hypothetical protein